MKKHLFIVGVLGFVTLSTSGCWLVAAGAGAEGGYIAAQEDRSASETISDQSITAGIKTRLLADSRVSGLDINVDTFKGNVTLKGIVESAEEASVAVQIARSVDGVKNVDTRLVID